jgi:hypothetical protein
MLTVTRQMFVALLAGVLLATDAIADDMRFRTQWSESCHNGKTSFELSFKSASGDPTEDDMHVTLK